MSVGEVVAGAGHGDGDAPIILLVEDELLIRLSLAELLREDRFVVLEAVNATEAATLVESGHPVDLVISDVRMPGEVDGVELSHWLKATNPFLPVVLVSGHMLDEGQHAADGFLRKPFPFDVLQALIGELIDPEWLRKRQERHVS